MPKTQIEAEISWELAVDNSQISDVAAIIVAAGDGMRMGGLSKTLLPILGIPVLMRALLPFERSSRICEIIVVAKESDIPEIQKLTETYNIGKLTAILAGGATRQESVALGIAACKDTVQTYCIHDGARPLVGDDVIARVIDAAKVGGAAAAAVTLKDTIKRIGSQSQVLDTPERASLRAVQTPQVFECDLYLRALAKARIDGLTVTDDCELIEHLGGEIMLVEGDERNIKITTPTDLAIAEAILLEDLK